VECIRDGYTTVMFDGPTLPPEQNLALTQDVVRVATRGGVSVEAEVGTIGTTAEYGAEIENPHLADPAACEAMGETRIDALAVAISNAHGVYIAEPKTDFDLLAEIRRRTDVPLVLRLRNPGRPGPEGDRYGYGQDERRYRHSRGLQGGMEEGLAENPGSHDIMKILSGCHGTSAGRSAPIRRHNHVRRTRCLTLASPDSLASLIGGLRRRTIPHRTSREHS
jgi:hypothetical protein